MLDECLPEYLLVDALLVRRHRYDAEVSREGEETVRIQPAQVYLTDVDEVIGPWQDAA